MSELCGALDGNVGLAFGLTVMAGLSINIGALAPYLPFGVYSDGVVIEFARTRNITIL